MSTMMDFDLFETATPLNVAEPEPITRVGQDAVTHTMKPDAEWDWHDLRDYVMREMEAVHGPQVRNSIKEKAIFSSFITRHGAATSAAIARFAFGFSKGMWANAPISVNRFCKGSDRFFADPIKQRLA
jgi:hypothetical protein